MIYLCCIGLHYIERLFSHGVQTYYTSLCSPPAAPVAVRGAVWFSSGSSGTCRAAGSASVQPSLLDIQLSDHVAHTPARHSVIASSRLWSLQAAGSLTRPRWDYVICIHSVTADCCVDWAGPALHRHVCVSEPDDLCMQKNNTGMSSVCFRCYVTWSVSTFHSVPPARRWWSCFTGKTGSN